MSMLRRKLLKLAHENPELRDSLVPLLASTRTAKKMTEKEWKAYKEKHPGADKSKHEIVKSDADKGSKGDKIPKGVDLSGVKPEQVEAFAGEIPEYKIEIIAGGEGGEITEADLRRAKSVKAQLKRGIQAAADICKMSPPVCEGNFGVARSSMPQLSADEPIKDMLKTDEQRIADMGDKWDDLSDEKKAKNKKDWATARKKGQAAVDAGADPDDDRTVFQQLLDSVAEEGVSISSQEPPFDKRPVGELKATQREIKAGKTYGIANAYLQGDYDPREAPIIISSDNHILDGHHRYSAMITADPDAKMNVIVVDMPMKKFLERSFDQPGVFRADLQDNIISSDDPLDLARDPGSTWEQKGKWYAKNKEGEASGPFKDKDGAEAYAKGEKKEDKKEDKPKKKAARDPLSRSDADKVAQRAKSRWSMVGRFDAKRLSSDAVLVMIPVGGSAGESLAKLALVRKDAGGVRQEDLHEMVEEGDHKAAEAAVRGIRLASEAPTLKGRLAKLAFDNPDMREALLPLLKD